MLPTGPRHIMATKIMSFTDFLFHPPCSLFDLIMGNRDYLIVLAFPDAPDYGYVLLILYVKVLILL